SRLFRQNGDRRISPRQESAGPYLRQGSGDGSGSHEGPNCPQGAAQAGYTGIDRRAGTPLTPMCDWKTIQRLFITSLPLQSSAIALLACALAGLVWLASPVTYSALDWVLYDAWLNRRAPITVSPNLAIIARDPASDDRFGIGPLDRAVL